MSHDRKAKKIFVAFCRPETYVLDLRYDQLVMPIAEVTHLVGTNDIALKLVVSWGIIAATTATTWC